ncbi:hypothetical protein FH972_026194 [Carpinus fangiana]|uniref:Large ribosomal subunit protein eL29 n=1 Tax=Carpinus fangiana TaxID=176857 RepID=A0A5N6L3F4_9ROSI|nr:hypothetical protein FH972_026194 [Carpinus fangiana]
MAKSKNSSQHNQVCAPATQAGPVPALGAEVATAQPLFSPLPVPAGTLCCEIAARPGRSLGLTCFCCDVQNKKDHKNGIKKPKTNRYPSLKGTDPKFRRNHRHALHGTAKALVCCFCSHLQFQYPRPVTFQQQLKLVEQRPRSPAMRSSACLATAPSLKIFRPLPANTLLRIDSEGRIVVAPGKKRRNRRRAASNRGSCASSIPPPQLAKIR